MQEVKEARVSIPGTEIDVFPARIFPGATASDLFEALNNDPEFHVQIDPSQFRITTFLQNGTLLAFDMDDDLYASLADNAILDLMPAQAPVMG